MEIQLTTFDLHDAIERVRRAVTPLADQKHQTLTVTVDPHAGTIHLDGVRLRQVLLNLLSNAVKYTPDGGSIATSVARRDGTIEIAVRDSGIGIAPEDQAKVFDEAMVGVHGRETAAMLEAYDFADVGVLADIGGGALMGGGFWTMAWPEAAAISLVPDCAMRSTVNAFTTTPLDDAANPPRTAANSGVKQ